MLKRKLGINIDHVATLRNIRGNTFPSVLKAALISLSSGADSITVHLREDQRHIKPNDVLLLKKKLNKPLNLEMALTKKMISFAIKVKPEFVCLVPEKRKELTTEGGLNLFYNLPLLKKSISRLKSFNISVSLFIDPEIKMVKQAIKLKADNIEIHTGSYCNFLNNKDKIKSKSEFNKIKLAARFAFQNKLGVLCGHGLNYTSTKNIRTIKEISEYNIGHFVISQSVFDGLSNVVKKLSKIIKN